MKGLSDSAIKYRMETCKKLKKKKMTREKKEKIEECRQRLTLIFICYKKPRLPHKSRQMQPPRLAPVWAILSGGLSKPQLIFSGDASGARNLCFFKFGQLRSALVDTMSSDADTTQIQIAAIQIQYEVPLAKK